MNKSTLKIISLFLSAIFLFASCASTTMIKCNVPDANLYLDGMKVGNAPYSMTDTKIVGSTTTVKIEKEGYETLNTIISRDEEADVGAIIGGLFIWVPFLWTMKYKPLHYYELEPTDNKRKSSIKTDYVTELRELKKLLDDGILTQSEYESEKSSILKDN